MNNRANTFLEPKRLDDGRLSSRSDPKVDRFVGIMSQQFWQLNIPNPQGYAAIALGPMHSAGSVLINGRGLLSVPPTVSRFPADPTQMTDTTSNDYHRCVLSPDRPIVGGLIEGPIQLACNMSGLPSISPTSGASPSFPLYDILCYRDLPPIFPLRSDISNTVIFAVGVSDQANFFCMRRRRAQLVLKSQENPGPQNLAITFWYHDPLQGFCISRQYDAAMSLASARSYVLDLSVDSAVTPITNPIAGEHLGTPDLIQVQLDSALASSGIKIYFKATDS